MSHQSLINPYLCSLLLSLDKFQPTEIGFGPAGCPNNLSERFAAEGIACSVIMDYHSAPVRVAINPLSTFPVGVGKPIAL